MSSYKLTYFNITGLAEPIRFIMSYSDIKFEDIRLTSEEWPKYQEDMPMHQIPVLEIDGKKYGQSMAILRYFAKKCNLYGKDDIEAMEIDAAADNIIDVRTALGNWYREKDEVQKEKLKEPAFKKLSLCLEKTNAQVKRNGPFLAGKKMSYADILWAASNSSWTHVLGSDVNKDHPELKKIVDKVLSDPKIKAYIEKRPKTEY